MRGRPHPSTSDAARAIQVAHDWERRQRPPRLGEPGFWQRSDVQTLRALLQFVALAVGCIVVAIRFEGTRLESAAVAVLIALLLSFFALIVAGSIIEPVRTLGRVARQLRDTTQPRPHLQAPGPLVDERARRQHQRAMLRRRIRILLPAVAVLAFLALEYWLRVA